MRRGRTQGRLGPAMAASALLHVAVVGLFLAGGAAAEPPPAAKVYRVDIVSAAPNQSGEPAAEPPMRTEPAAEVPPPLPVPATPPAAAEVAAEVAPVEPRPDPAPTKKRAAPATRPPEPRPATPPAAKPTASTSKPAAAAPARPVAKPGPGTDGAGTRPVPATGPKPVASNAGGEGLNVRTEGAEFVDRAYLDNIIRQVRRYFRPPAGARTERAEVRFWIERDGSVSDIEIVRSSGSFAFRVAAMEGVEQAGKRGAFGPLPRAFPADRLPIVFEFLPPR